MKAKKMEILAPAGSLHALYAAVLAGADAVYLGGKQFNARAFASNFTEKELVIGIHFAHRHGVRIYMTMNTLLRNEEIPEAIAYAKEAYLQGVDAFIIQDFGLLFALQRELPHMELHASTQMTIHNLEGVCWAAEQGLKRVVLARELSMEEIQHIKANSPIGLEVFTHGALCFAYSGQCYMSSFLGGRSGNRGRCAQPCRLPYKVDGKEGYFLSTKDLCLIDEIRTLSESGVDAIKIEGRMKKPSYVYQVVRQYRMAVDAGSSQTPERFVPDYDSLLLAFNREFTKGFGFQTKNPSMLRVNHPGNRGLELARWKSNQWKKETTYKLGSAQIIKEGDRLLLLHGDQELVFTSDRSYQEGMILTLPWLDLGLNKEDISLSLIESTQLEQETQEQIVHGQETEKLRPVILDIIIKVEENQPTNLVLKSVDAQWCFSYEGIRAVAARDEGLTEMKVRQSFDKLKDTPYMIRSLVIEQGSPCYLSISSLNAIRRDWVERLWYGVVRSIEEEEVKPTLPAVSQQKKATKSGEINLQWAVSNIDQALPLLDMGMNLSVGGDSFYGRLSVIDFRKLVHTAREKGIEIELSLPTIIHQAEWPDWMSFIQAAGELSCPIRISQPAQWPMVSTHAPNVLVRGDWSFQLMNDEAISGMVQQIPFERLTIYPELSLQQATDFPVKYPNIQWQYMVGGRQNLMISNHCLTWNRQGHCLLCYKNGNNNPPDLWKMTDRLGKTFWIAQNQYCRTHLLNSSELCLVEHFYQLQRSGFHHWLVDLRHISPNQVGEIAGIWVKAFLNFKKDSSDWLQKGKEYRLMLEENMQIETTKGHTFRGVE